MQFGLWGPSFWQQVNTGYTADYELAILKIAQRIRVEQNLFTPAQFRYFGIEIALQVIVLFGDKA